VGRVRIMPGILAFSACASERGEVEVLEYEWGNGV